MVQGQHVFVSTLRRQSQQDRPAPHPHIVLRPGAAFQSPISEPVHPTRLCRGHSLVDARLEPKVSHCLTCRRLVSGRTYLATALATAELPTFPVSEVQVATDDTLVKFGA